MAVLSLCFPPSLQAQNAAAFTYITNQNAITITGGCPGSPRALVIPETINGLPVTSIGRLAFLGCSSLTTITIPNSVTSIGEGAFVGTSLTSVVIPNSVTHIGHSAFSSCTGLTNLVISNGVTSIGMGTFAGCTSLTSITIPNSVMSIGDEAFYDCASLTSITIGNSVISVGARTFSDCASLPSVVIPNSVTSIGDEAFSRCTGLTNVTIGNSVASIGDEAFASCTSLTNVVIPNSVTSIGDEAFLGCESLTSVTIGKSVTSIRGYTFFGCTSLTRIHFQGNAPIFRWDALEWPNMVTNYYLPGTAGWGAVIADRPTAPWVLPEPVILTSSPGVVLQTNDFGFRISWATNSPVVVEAATSLTAPEWSPVSTNALVDGWGDFRDPTGAGQGQRFYRVRGP